MKQKDKTVLIVDDDTEMCWVLEYLLKKNGFHIQKALSGSDAITLFRQNHFQLIFLDAKLPDIEGFEQSILSEVLAVDTSSLIKLTTITPAKNIIAATNILKKNVCPLLFIM